MAEYYVQRASAGLLITEATGISRQGLGWKDAPGVWTDEMKEGWKNVTQKVHAAGGVMFMQLWHMGRQGHSTVCGDVVSASNLPVTTGQVTTSTGERVPYETPRALETAEIPAIVEDYRKAAQNAKDAGLDGVEIHAANGYLIDQFLQSTSNKRTDQYGGSFENRFRFLREIVEAITTVFPANRVGVRISPNGVYGSMGSEDNDQMFLYVAEQLSKYGLAYLHVMDGLGFGAHDKCRFLNLFELKCQFKGLIIGNIGYTKESGDGAVRSGAADMIAYGRPFINNPDLVERFENNWPLDTNVDYTVFYNYSLGAQGYTSYPKFDPSTLKDGADKN
eukprot:GILI01006184.1.p1 GENE.GILI01006184.1~~GILI01006184.1.p1  ORF type:complete len:389 (+),score=119.55 GILI01006184.1:168-1169(+)